MNKLTNLFKQSDLGLVEKSKGGIAKLKFLLFRPSYLDNTKVLDLLNRAHADGWEMCQFDLLSKRKSKGRGWHFDRFIKRMRNIYK